MKRCSCCGQVIPPDVVLPGPVAQRVYNLLRSAPHTAHQLRELVYGRRAIAHNSIYAEIKFLRRQLAAYGLTVNHPPRCGEYYLEELHAHRRTA